MVSASSPARHDDTNPVASVSPYAVSTVSNPSSDHMRSTSDTGTAAAPVTARRSDDRSNVARSGWLRIVWYTAGAPGIVVMPWAATLRMASGTSNTACGYIVAPT